MGQGVQVEHAMTPVTIHSTESIPVHQVLQQTSGSTRSLDECHGRAGATIRKYRRLSESIPGELGKARTLFLIDTPEIFQEIRFNAG